MATSTLPRPAQPGAAGGDDSFDHLYCCDPETALCGAYIGDLNDVGHGPLPSECHVCPMCEVLEEQGGACPAPDCPDRVASRRRRFGFRR